MSGAVVPAAWHAFDLSSPWLGPYQRQAQRVVASIQLEAGRLRFVEASALPLGRAYESHVALTATVPSRDNRHDLFNGIVWLRFAALKRRLNELQAAEIAAHGVGSERGVLRDALTLFDENGALLTAPGPLVDALRRRDWQRLFVTGRDAWRDARLTLFGHALLDKLTAPRKPITAHVLIVDRDADALSQFTAERLATKPFTALPVLGVPGWWQANEAPAFYADPAVFRAAR